MKYPEEIYLERVKELEATLQTAMNEINALKDALAYKPDAGEHLK